MIHSLFLTHWYPSESKPVNGTFIREHARAVSIYNKVTVIHIEGIDQAHPFTTKEQDGNITIYRLRYPKPALPKTGWWYRLRGVRQVFSQLSREQALPDIIHAHIYSSADLAYIFSRRYHLPAILTEHASVYPRNLLRKTQAITIRFYLNRLQLILPVSEALCLHMQRYGIKGPFQVISNTVDTDLFHPPHAAQSPDLRTNWILMVATLSPVKGIKHLLQAFHKLIQERKDVELIIVGDGPERNSLEKMTIQFGIDEKVTFLGLKSKPEVAEIMRRASLFALTSIWDNLPSVLVEAMACGLPIVSSNVGGIPEIVKPFCGRLVEPGNPASIAEGIAYVLDHPDQFPEEQIASYAREKFSHPVIGKRIADVYQSVLSDYHDV